MRGAIAWKIRLVLTGRASRAINAYGYSVPAVAQAHRSSPWRCGHRLAHGTVDWRTPLSCAGSASTATAYTSSTMLVRRVIVSLVFLGLLARPSSLRSARSTIASTASSLQPRNHPAPGSASSYQFYERPFLRLKRHFNYPSADSVN